MLLQYIWQTFALNWTSNYFSYSLSIKQKLIIADFFLSFFLSCVLSCSAQAFFKAKLIKDTQLLSLLTCLLFPLLFFQPLHPSICPSVFPQLENKSRWKGSVLPDARWSSDRGSTKRNDGGRGEKPKCTPTVTAQQCSLLRPVIRQRWPFPELPL